MEGQLKQARISLEKYVNPKILNKQINEDTRIPKWVLKRAKGLVFLTVIKAGFLFAGNVGTGCIIIRKPNGGWTGPSSIGVAGVSFGFLAGASKIDYIMILPDDKAVKQFTGKGQLRLGGEIQLAVGPVTFYMFMYLPSIHSFHAYKYMSHSNILKQKMLIIFIFECKDEISEKQNIFLFDLWLIQIGRDGSGSVGAGDKGVSVIYSYSHAQGLYGGLALDGKVISVRPDCNKTFYKKSVTCADILNGNIENIPKNEDYDMMIHLLDSYCLDSDMTPIKGERLSIDDLNNDNNNNNKKINEEKKDPNNDEPGQKDDVLSKIQTGFGKFKSSVSQKFLSLTQIDDNQNKEKVKLQKSESQNKGKKYVEYKPDENVNINNNPSDVIHDVNIQNNNNNNNANYQIGDDVPDDDEEQ